MKAIRLFSRISVIAVLFLSLVTVKAHAAEDHRVKVINHASSPIRYLYASNIDQNTWGYDILGANTMIFTNYYMIINFDDGTDHCHFDLKAVLADGRVAVTRNVDVCSVPSWTVTDTY